MGKVTDVMNARAAECEDMEDLIAFRKEFDGEVINFSEFMKDLLKRKNMTKAQFMELYNSSNDMYSWFRGTSMPSDRYQFITIAIITGMTPAEADLFLTRVGGWGKLYPKNIEDAACIHTLLHHLSYKDYALIKKRMEQEIREIMYNLTQDSFPADYRLDRESIPRDEHYYDAIDALDKRYEEIDKKKKHDRDKLYLKARNSQDKFIRLNLLKSEPEFIGTEVLLADLSETTDLIQYVRDNWKAIITANYKAVDYLQAKLQTCEIINAKGKRITTLNALLSYYCKDYLVDKKRQTFAVDDTGHNILFDGSMNTIKKKFSNFKCHYDINISRSLIILLCVLLEMNEEEINTVLGIAHMDYLCSRRFEDSSVIAAIHADENIPLRLRDFYKTKEAARSVELKEMFKLFFSDEDSQYIKTGTII